MKKLKSKTSYTWRLGNGLGNKQTKAVLGSGKEGFIFATKQVHKPK